MSPKLRIDSVRHTTRRPAATLVGLTMTALVGLAGEAPASAATETRTTLSSTTATSSFGQPVSFVATVRGARPGSGTVMFTSDGVPISGCEAVALKSDITRIKIAESRATCTTSSLPVGTHSIIAWFSGSLTVAASNSQPLTHTVNKAVTAIRASCSPNPVIYPDRATCTATVTSQYFTPTGKVTWSTSGRGYFVSSACVLERGTCSVPYKPSAADVGWTGGINIRAAYLETAEYTASSTTTSLAVR